MHQAHAQSSRQNHECQTCLADMHYAHTWSAHTDGTPEDPELSKHDDLAHARPSQPWQQGPSVMMATSCHLQPLPASQSALLQKAGKASCVSHQQLPHADTIILSIRLHISQDQRITQKLALKFGAGADQRAARGDNCLAHAPMHLWRRPRAGRGTCTRDSAGCRLCSPVCRQVRGWLKFHLARLCISPAFPHEQGHSQASAVMP